MPSLNPERVRRRAEIMELKAQGWTNRVIAGRVGVSESQVSRNVSAACKEYAEQEYESTAQLRALVKQGLDVMKATWFEAAKEDLNALDRVMRIWEVERKMFGLDAPDMLKLEAAVRSGEIEDNVVEIVYVNEEGVREDTGEVVALGVEEMDDDVEIYEDEGEF